MKANTLEELIEYLSKRFDVSYAKLARIVVKTAKWQEERSKKPFTDEFMKKVISIWKTRANGDISQPVQFSFDETIALLRAGAEWQKEQMLKDAIDARVYYRDSVPGGEFIEIVADILNPTGVRYKDKVKVVIVKEDEK